MTEERILTAVERIDGAVARIEAAARRPLPHQADADGADPAALADLRERHATLRGQVEAAIGELDMLIRNG